MRRDPLVVRAEGRLVDQSLVLTVVTLLLLTPPLLRIFDQQVFLFGISLLHVYCYTVWLIAIGCGAFLAARLGARGHNTDGQADSTKRD